MDKRRKLAGYGMMLHADRLVIGAGGNISERDGDFLIVKKRGADMSSGKAGDYIRLRFSEAEKAGESRLSSETPAHIACYRARKDVGAVVHVHSPIIIAAGRKTDLLESVSYEFDCILQKAVPVIEYIQPGSSLLAEAVGLEIKSGATAVILKKHGAISVGEDMEEAYLRILALERACFTFLHG
ncbi:MAG: hypothetical protein DRP85_07925 [Candidatus Makaraimicrobium thalassicum]|nr:MAG: hypothetical protein DRP85_07925 [Candidatus Omnitrophota bacterium]